MDLGQDKFEKSNRIFLPHTHCKHKCFLFCFVLSVSLFVCLFVGWFFSFRLITLGSKSSEMNKEAETYRNKPQPLVYLLENILRY